MVGGITAAELDDMDIPALSWRWMDLRYAGTCKVCGARIGKGERGYWHAGARTVTCSALSCCEADGLTTQQWSGSPVSGQFVVSRSEHRVGTGGCDRYPVQFGGDGVPQCSWALRGCTVLRMLRLLSRNTSHENHHRHHRLARDAD